MFKAYCGNCVSLAFWAQELTITKADIREQPLTRQSFLSMAVPASLFSSLCHLSTIHKALRDILCSQAQIQHTVQVFWQCQWIWLWRSDLLAPSHTARLLHWSQPGKEDMQQGQGWPQSVVNFLALWTRTHQVSKEIEKRGWRKSS